MADFVHEFFSLSRRRSALGAMFVMLVGYLSVAMMLPEDPWGASATDWLILNGYLVVFSAIEFFLVRSLARDAGLPGRPRVGMWLGALVAYGVLIYAGAFALEVLSYLILKDLMTQIPVEWHFGLMQLPIALILFPFTVWRCALLCGERSVGLWRCWRGIWVRRRYILVIATIIVGFFALFSLGLESLLGPNLVGLPEPLGFALILLPAVAGTILAMALSFGAFLRIRSEDVESAPFV